MSQETKDRISKKLQGHPSFMNGYKHSEEIKKRISETHKGRHHSSNTEFKKGHRHSKDILKKISNSLKGKLKGSENPRWKGGQYKKAGGYVLILTPSHPRTDCKGYVKRSRLVMEKYLGRYLTPKEVVHHKGKKDDDRIEMLRLFANQSKHTKFHHKIKSTAAGEPRSKSCSSNNPSIYP